MRRLLVALLASALTVLVACLGAFTAPATAHADDRPMLKVALTSDIDTFNPFIAVLLSSTQINRFQYESLTQYGVENDVVPGLASKWETTEGGRTWTFTMPEGRQWSDGQPLTSEDAAWTIQQIMDKEALQQANGSLVSNVAKVETPDAQTLVMRLKSPQASNPGNEIPIVPKHVWEKQDAEKYANDSNVVGSGPFTITKYTQGQSVQLVSNPHFWRGEPKIGGVTWVVYKNGDAAVQALRTGEVDIVGGVTPAQFDSLKNQPGITTNNGAGRRYQALAINPGAVDNKDQPLGDGNPVLKDEQVRKAIIMAVDPQVLTDRALGGYGKVGETEMPTVYADYFGFAPGYERFPHDPAQANTLLDQAGYPKGADGIRTDKQGKPIKLRLMGRNNDPTHQQMADFITPWLKDIGIQTDVSMVSPTQVNNDSTLGKYDLYFTGWSLGPDPDFQLSINTCASRPNADGSGDTSENNWCSKQFDELYNQQHAELDPAKRAELVKQAFSVLYQGAVAMPIFYADQLEAYRSDKFTDFTKSPSNGGVISNQNGYWGFTSVQPASASNGGAAGDGGSGTSPLVWVGVAVAVVVVAGVVVAVVRRRGGGAEDRE